MVDELCVAGRFLIVNPQGPDLFVVPGRTHLSEDVPDHDGSGIGWADSPTGLKGVRDDGYENFVDYRKQVMGS